MTLVGGELVAVALLKNWRNLNLNRYSKPLSAEEIKNPLSLRGAQSQDGESKVAFPQEFLEDRRLKALLYRILNFTDEPLRVLVQIVQNAVKAFLFQIDVKILNVWRDMREELEEEFLKPRWR